MKTVQVNSAKELKAFLKVSGSSKISIEKHPLVSFAVNVECSNKHAHYYSASIQGEVYIKFPVNVSF